MLSHAGKISELEAKLNDHKVELQRKDKTISKLEAELEAATIRINSQNQIEEISTHVLRVYMIFYYMMYNLQSLMMIFH